MFLLSADPSNVDLEKVANIIVDQSLKDCVFSKEAGRICYTIIQVRSPRGPDSETLKLVPRLGQERLRPSPALWPFSQLSSSAVCPVQWQHPNEQPASTGS